ncbi:MAG: hypothetical protein A2Y33_00215 [Spirochaetes bacterium GWF1_51_8]|nr:MAG: hypothetical protein A2Y33_00215 [Spirochaetes bacterium GWF1_51_8]
MPNIELKDVENTAKLAKLEFSGAEKEKFAEQFSKIVKFVEKIGELNTDDIPPTTHAVEKRDVVRDDTVKQSMPVDLFSKTVPKAMDGSIVVPRVIEH